MLPQNKLIEYLKALDNITNIVRSLIFQESLTNLNFTPTLGVLNKEINGRNE